MAATLPDALQLRDLKYGEKHSAEARRRMAQRFFEAGRMAEALDLFHLAGDDAGVQAVRDRVLAEGRPHAILSLIRVGLEVTAAEWSQAGHGALAAGRFREAFRCFTEAADEDGLAAVHEKIPSYEIYTPQGK
ncbi:MAG: hypothetical protein ACYTGN_17820 [Planctomycetota bacterium]|jgi:hypothetical protein